LASALSYSFYARAPMDLRHDPGRHPPSLHALHRATQELLRSFGRFLQDVNGWREDLQLSALQLRAAQPKTLVPQPVADPHRPAQPLRAETCAQMHCIALHYEDRLDATGEITGAIDQLVGYLTHCTDRIKVSWNSASSKEHPPFRN